MINETPHPQLRLPVAELCWTVLRVACVGDYILPYSIELVYYYLDSSCKEYSCFAPRKIKTTVKDLFTHVSGSQLRCLERHFTPS